MVRRFFPSKQQPLGTSSLTPTSIAPCCWQRGSPRGSCETGALLGPQLVSRGLPRLHLGDWAKPPRTGGFAPCCDAAAKAGGGLAGGLPPGGLPCPPANPSAPSSRPLSKAGERRERNQPRGFGIRRQGLPRHRHPLLPSFFPRGRSWCRWCWVWAADRFKPVLWGRAETAAGTSAPCGAL